jgi:tRNA pseudouridine55 synthase
MATGVLVLLFGEATKLSSLCTQHEKTYVAELSFGRSTDSYDAQGETTDERNPDTVKVTEVDLLRALECERQRLEQRPPAVSAVKVNGERAYRLARKGAPPVLPSRPVRVSHLELLDHTPRGARVRLRVSPGYYVRSFAADIGQLLAMPTHLSALRREQSGVFTLAAACGWPPRAEHQPVPLQEILPNLLPTVRLSSEGVVRARQGKRLDDEHFLDAPAVALRHWTEGRGRADTLQDPRAASWGWTDENSRPIALGQLGEDGHRVQRGFHLPNAS